MGLRFYEKYLLLFGFFVTGCFFISGVFFYINTDYNKNSVKRKQLIRDVADKDFVEQLSDKDHNSSLEFKFNNQRETSEQRRDFVKQMMKFAWNNYVRYAWGENELKPISKVGHSGSIFGQAPLGATIVDSIDTLYIMGFDEEFRRARGWVADSFNLLNSKSDLSVFETTIRFVGGLLSSYALTKDQVFLDKARAVADLLLPAFDASPTGIPLALINVKTGRTGNYGWASGGCSILSEFGSLELEFDYLSRLTENQTYSSKATRIREFVTRLKKPDGLYPNYLNPQNGKWCQKHISVGALGDSFYEYLLKTWYDRWYTCGSLIEQFIKDI